MQRYLVQVQSLSYAFVSLIGEAFGLPSDALACFYDADELMQHRGKVGSFPQLSAYSFETDNFTSKSLNFQIVKYPTIAEDAQSDQGVGPHYDAGFLTFVIFCLVSNRSRHPHVYLPFFIIAFTSITSPRPAGPEPVWTMDRCPSYSWNLCC